MYLEKQPIVTIKKSIVREDDNDKHIASSIQADTLFNFTSNLKYLIDSIKIKMLSPRYCTEDIRYLGIKEVERIAIPMKCFCDINLHRIGEHMEWYGYYGLAFSKEWGMKRKIQPVQYINENSHLRDDLSVAFSVALEDKNETKETDLYKDFLLHELMYWKPYQGFFTRHDEIMKNKCFTDECEWRFIPDVTVEGFDQVIFKENKLDENVYNNMSNAMNGLMSVSLEYEYTDIKHIIIKTESDFLELTEAISDLQLTKTIENELISKIIVWDRSGGDF